MNNFLQRFLIFFFKILLGCLLGCIILLLYASRSEVVRQEIKKSVQKTFKEEFDCDWDGQVTSIDLLTLHIQFSKVSIFPCNRDDNWSLYADKFDITASLLDFIVYRKLSCHGCFEQAIVYEKQILGTSHFVQVLSKMFSSQLPSNISFDYITIKQSDVILQDALGDGQLSYHYDCQMSRERDGLHTKLYVIDGNLIYKDRTIFEKMFGNFVSIIPYNNDLQEVYVRVDCRLTIPSLQDKGSCFLVGDLYRSRGAFVISNEDQSFIIEPLKIRLKQNALPCTCSISMESDIVQKIIAQQIFLPDLTGNVTFTLSGNLLNLADGVQGNLQIQDVAYKNNRLIDKAIVSFEKQDDGYITKGVFHQDLLFEGLWTACSDRFNFSLTNVEQLPLWWNRYWDIPVGKGKISGVISSDLSQAQGDYHVQLASAKLDTQIEVKGSFGVDSETFNCKGSFLDRTYSCLMQLQPLPHVIEFNYRSMDEVFINFHEQQNSSQGTLGFVGFNFIKNLLPEEYKSSFSQPGKFDIAGKLQQGSYYAQVTSDNAHIRIPSLYNVMQNFTAATIFDFMGRSIVMNDMFMHLYEGTVRCDHMVVNFDNKLQTSFVYAPLFLDNVLMSFVKGIFGIVSGRLFLSQQEGQVPQLQGNLMVDKAQLKGNIFSQEFQKQLVGSVGSSPGIDIDGMLDVTIETKEPVLVETSFLQALIHFDLHVGNTMQQPEIEGTIDIASGELKFPYKSLFITDGQIVIMPKHSTEPMLEFVAKGKIKRYDITMRAMGTMMDQQIHFESSPYLTEEQIISLLLTGSQDSSLSAVMPAMFMQKLHEIVFGPAISKSKLDVLFHRLLQSFKNVRIFPQFTNQTGRGGVRGVVEIDATDRLHGRIDSNLMQLEDTIFEADYMLTDDVSVRAIKDGPSTYGGEVEMRWKFS